MKTSSVLAVLFVLFAMESVRAGSATWLTQPSSGDWNTAANWTPAGPPNGPSDVATFGFSSITGISMSADTEVDSVVFNAGASGYTINSGETTWMISGAGILNNSGVGQNFVTAYDTEVGIQFRNAATAGSLTSFTNNSFITGARNGGIEFFDTSSAGSATITNIAPEGQASTGGTVTFRDSSTAGTSTITNNAFDTFNHNPTDTQFLDGSTAGHATIIAEAGSASTADGSFVDFDENSSAGNATLIAYGGLGVPGIISFIGHATGGTARVMLLNGGQLNGATLQLRIGSIEGDGVVDIDTTILTVGGNNLSTTFAGVIEQGLFSSGGSVVKVGTGALTLSGANTYTGGTTVQKGTLTVANTTGSGTGTGAVQVTGGTLDGTGIISGAVAVGSATHTATLAPGASRPGTLTIGSALTFNSRGSFRVSVSRGPRAGMVVANGVTIISGAQIVLQSTGTFPLGTALTVISNTSGTPISGVFANLADGATISAGGTNFQASYEGGDGNDLTLTVQ